jgi:hypothetical protein
MSYERHELPHRSLQVRESVRPSSFRLNVLVLGIPISFPIMRRLPNAPNFGGLKTARKSSYLGQLGFEVDL